MLNALVYIPFAFGGNPAAESGPRCIKHIIDNNKIVFDADIFYFEQKINESPNRFLEILTYKLNKIIKKYDRLVLMGGNHLSILPLYRILYQRNTKDTIITLDAHRDYYPENKLSHASFLSSLCKNDDTKHYLVGARDFERHQEQNDSIEILTDDLSKHPISNITLLDIDVDVINPEIFPSCGSPIDGGLSYEKIKEYVRFCNKRGCKIMSISEYIPNWDNAQTNARMILEITRIFLNRTE